ncbi:MAG TPA: TetR/AcrR family transcriptional regulator [Thermomicrobiales bacterium]|nr:TetR/AcrR family transcriptional regulator [Thermomicrobiales bacterium]
MAKNPVRMSAAERREQILAIAAEAFARQGLHGVSVDTIARQAGISQAYVFRLFGTKVELFRQVIARAFAQMTAGMAAAAGDLRGPDAIMAMGAEYRHLVEDRTALLLHLQGYAACDDPEVQETVRTHFRQLWETVATLSGMDPLRVKIFLALGMLINDATAMDVLDLDEDWARGVLTPIPVELYTTPFTGKNPAK